RGVCCTRQRLRHVPGIHRKIVIPPVSNNKKPGFGNRIVPQQADRRSAPRQDRSGERCWQRNGISSDFAGWIDSMDKPAILIIEDDDEVRTQMKWALTQHYDVLLAENRVNALRTLKEHKP